MIKKFIYLITLMLLITAYSCKKGIESYLFVRPTHSDNFQTELHGDLYAYTSSDTAISRADYFMRVEGYLMNYGEAKIIQYGHCWKKVSGSGTITPNISDENLITVKKSPLPPLGDSISFDSDLINLEADTEYGITSYVIVERSEEGKVVREVGYNPKISVIKTRPAIDEWFEQCAECNDGKTYQPSTNARYDAVAFNLGDTIFFGTGIQSGYRDPLNDIMVYDPRSKRWLEQVITIPISDFVKNLPNPGFRDGIGFAMAYQRPNKQSLTRSIFVGFGIHGQGANDISNFLLEYDLEEGQWHKRAENRINKRSGTICFVLNSRAYIGTGKSQSGAHHNWFVFDPALAASEKPKDITNSFRSVSGAPKIPRTGAVSFTLNGRGYFGLGTNGKGTFYKDFWMFVPHKQDPTDGNWQRISDFPGRPRANAVAFTIGQFAYVGTGDDLVSLQNEANFMQKEGAWSGTVYNDFYRYNPYINSWRKVADYTSNKGISPIEDEKRVGAVRPITRAVGFALQGNSIGFTGYGLLPTGYTEKYAEEHANEKEEVKRTIMQPKQTTSMPAQRDFWKYQPFNINNQQRN